jgi:hypothetical protein
VPYAGWLGYLDRQDLLDDADVLQALTEDSDFLSRTLHAYREWAANEPS